MNTLIFMSWSVFFLSCNCISNTLKNTAVIEIKNSPEKEIVSQIHHIKKGDDSKTKPEIIHPTSSEKVVAEEPIDFHIEEYNTKLTDSILENSTKIASAIKNNTAPLSKEKAVIWHELLLKHVNTNGDVNYKGFLKDKDKLEAYLDDMAINNPKPEWSKKEKLVYYINLYNAGTVKLILDNYPVNSIKDINKPWAKKIIKIGENTYSLGEIEHKILRKMNEPRIHFAINCASYSCPKLINSSFTVSNLEKMLEAATIGFINDPKRNEITTDNLHLSHIFKWYKKDFTENGSLVDYINPYIKTNIKEKATISFLKYDWSLNEAK